MAPGPSLCRDDLDVLRPHVGYTLAINCGVFFVPWADEVFAADAGWWRYYGPKIKWFQGKRSSRTCKRAGIQVWRGKGWPRTGGNSGHMGIQKTVDTNKTSIVIIGFDQQKTNGKAHCHADHPKAAADGQRTNMANVGGIGAWPRLMTRTAVDLKERGVTVVNLSRQTALRCFPRMTVEQFLKEQQGLI